MVRGMADFSVVGSVETKLRTFDNLPPVYLFDAPVNTGAAQLYPPYIVIVDDGLSPQYEFELTVMEQTGLRLMIYGNSLAQVNGYVEIIKYNAGTIAQALGLDFGTLPNVPANYNRLEVRRLSEQRFISTPTGIQGQRIFGCEMHYRVSMYRNS